MHKNEPDLKTMGVVQRAHLNIKNDTCENTMQKIFIKSAYKRKRF